MRVLAWAPLLVVAAAFFLVFAFVLASPPPANGFGHSIYDVHQTLTIPAGSTLTVVIGDAAAIPRGSLAFVHAGVLNQQPGSDLSEMAYFRLTHGDTVFHEGVSSVGAGSFETRFDSSGSGNPQLFVRNDHPFDLLVDYRSWVIRPPTALEHFGLYLPVLLPALVAATLWFMISHGRTHDPARTG